MRIKERETRLTLHEHDGDDDDDDDVFDCIIYIYIYIYYILDYIQQSGDVSLEGKKRPTKRTVFLKNFYFD